MRILYLTPRVPYPPNKGDKIRSYHHLRHLAQAHDVYLLSFVDRPEEAQWADTLRNHCAKVDLVRLRTPMGVGRGALALARARSFCAGYYRSAGMWRAVHRATAAERFDVVWAFSSVMAQYLPATGTSRRVLDFVDVDSEKWRQWAARAGAPLGWAYGLEARRLRQLERRGGTLADRVLFVSAEEAALFQTFARAAAAVRVVPNGVNTDFFRPPRDRPVAQDPNILFTGALDYRPNVDAVVYFAREVLPRVRREIPAAQFTAVGHRPSRRLRRAIQPLGDTVRIAGSVPDVRPYFGQARVCVAPLRLGRGVQNKVLEAMAMGVPVVVSPVAAQGLAVNDGVDVLVAETAEQCAAAVVALLRDPERCRRLVENARRLIERAYRWDVNLRLLDACLDQGEVRVTSPSRDAVAAAAHS